MKKFLQKTLALLALCLVSLSAMAETVTFDLSSIPGYGGNYGTPIVKDGISVASTTWYAELYGDGSWAMLKVEGVEANISQIVLNLRPYDSNSYCAIDANTGAFSGSIYGPSVTWSNTENVKSVVFTSAYDTADFYVTSMTVTYTPAAPSTTFEFGSAYPEAGNLTTTIDGGITVYHNNGTLAYAGGKSAADITFNDVSVPYVGVNDGSLWISCTATQDGTYVLHIPAGTFVNTAGKTNEEFTQTYTLALPGFTMTSAEWTTYCADAGWTMPTNYDGYVVSAIQDGTAVLTKAYPTGTVVPAYTSLLVNGPEAAKVVTPAGYYGSTPAKNYLCSVVNLGNGEATFEQYHISMYFDYALDGESSCYLYKLSYDSNGENLGFYWDSDDGRSLTCKPNKAFLVVPTSMAPAVNALAIRIDKGTEGIQNVVTEDSNVIYNLQGQRVNATKPGVYVKNGKKFIVK